jgi:cytidylate kinase
MAIITISRGSMELGQGLAGKLAAALGYPCVEREIIVEAAQKMGVSGEVMDQKMEHPSFWDRLSSDRRKHILAMQAVLAEHVLGGDFVYHSWAGHLLLREIPALRVRVIAPLEVRVPFVIERHKMTRQQALVYIHRMDEERARWTRFIYGIDWTDPTLYDVVLNLGTMSVDTACDAVIAMVKRSDFALEQIRAKLESFALVTRVRWALAANRNTGILDLQVHAEDGLVTVCCLADRATMPTIVEHALEEELRDVVMKVSGVKEMKLAFQKP